MFVLVAFSDPVMAHAIEDGFRVAQTCRGVRLASIRASGLADPSRFDRLPDALIAESEAMVGAHAARLRSMVSGGGIPTFLLTRPNKARQHAQGVDAESRTMFLDREMVLVDTSSFATSVVTYLRMQAPSAAL